MGALAGPAPGDGISQFNEVDFRGALAFTVTACLVSVIDHAIAAMIDNEGKVSAAQVGRALVICHRRACRIEGLTLQTK